MLKILPIMVTTELNNLKNLKNWYLYIAWSSSKKNQNNDPGKNTCTAYKSSRGTTVKAVPNNIELQCCLPYRVTWLERWGMKVSEYDTWISMNEPKFRLWLIDIHIVECLHTGIVECTIGDNNRYETNCGQNQLVERHAPFTLQTAKFASFRKMCDIHVCSITSVSKARCFFLNQLCVIFLDHKSWELMEILL